MPEHPGLKAVLPQPAKGLPAGNPIRPRPIDRWVAQPKQFAPDQYENLLQDVLGQMLVAYQSNKVAVQPVLHVAQQLIQRTAVACLGEQEQRDRSWLVQHASPPSMHQRRFGSGNVRKPGRKIAPPRTSGLEISPG